MIGEKGKAIKIVSILLMECYFKRLPNIAPDGKSDFTIEVNPSVDPKTDNVVTTLKLDAVSKLAEETQVEARISVAGTFDCKGLSQEEKETFSRINAPAIIFPFVREQLLNMNQKAGINLPLLNPINFVAYAKAGKQKEKSKVHST